MAKSEFKEYLKESKTVPAVINKSWHEKIEIPKEKTRVSTAKFGQYLKETGDALYAWTTMNKSKDVPGLVEHDHKCKINLFGSGMTDDFDGAFMHAHMIKDGEVQEVMGHTHKLKELFDNVQEMEESKGKGKAGISNYLKERK